MCSPPQAEELGPMLIAALQGDVLGSENTAAVYMPIVHFTDQACQVLPLGFIV